MELEDVVRGADIIKIIGPTGIGIRGITGDSRKIKKGFLFVAIKGLTVDAKKFIPDAIRKGAVAIVCSFSNKSAPLAPALRRGPAGFKSEKTKGVTFVEVKNDRRALSIIAGNWFGNPSKKLKLIAVTGTDGKTTTCNFIYSILKAAGKKVGLITSISAKVGDKESPIGFHVTNPEPIPLQKFLSQMVKKGMEYCVLEVTSHGLDQERTAGIEFEAALITNVTREHLDYHKSYKELCYTKAKIFRQSRKVFLNKDSPGFLELKKLSPKGFIPFSFKDYNPNFVLGESFPGLYNLQNAAGAAKVCGFLGIRRADILKGLKGIKKLEGRFEYVDKKQPFDVVIDFAHTPNALENVLKVAGEKTKGKVISVFGSAGLRDTKKRPVMGKISQTQADLVVLTAEDPRTEDVNGIINQISKGNIRAGGEENRTFFKIPNREKAISFAIKKLAKKGDLVIITGKGHEKSMCYGEKEYPWSDHEAVKKALSNLG